MFSTLLVVAMQNFWRTVESELNFKSLRVGNSGIKSEKRKKQNKNFWIIKLKAFVLGL